MKRVNSQIILLTLIATLGGLLFGYDTAVLSGAVGSLRAYFIDPLHLAPDAANSMWGIVSSSALIGCIIGGLAGGWVSNRIGRKRGLVLAAVLFLISALGAAAPEFPFAPIGHGGPAYVWGFVIYRILGGIGVGLASMLSPMFIAEIAPAKVRGNLVAWNQFAIIFGMLVIYFVNYGISRAGSGDAWLNTIGWRYMFLSGAIPALLFLLLLFLVPETPRYLMLKSDEAGARAVLARLGTPQENEKEIAEIRASLSEHHSGKIFFVRRAAHFHRHHAVGVPAVRRHQRGAVLRAGDFQECGLQHQRVAVPNDHCGRGQPPLHRGGHHHGGSAGPQAAANHRRAGHGRGDAGAGLHVCHAGAGG